MKIDSMSPKKWEKIPAIRQRLIDLESTPLNKDATKQWITALYQAAGFSKPKVLFFPSPQAMYSCALQSLQIGASLNDHLREQLREPLRDQLGEQLESQLRAQLWEQLWEPLNESLRGQLREPLRGQLIKPSSEHLFTQSLAAYLGWFQGSLLAGVRFDSAKMTLFQGYIENVGLTLPFENVCLCSERPIKIHWRDGILHNEADMAVTYSDGWGWYAIDGIRVDRQVVVGPETQTIEQIQAEDNEEIRRIRIARFGWHRYLTEAKAEVIDVSTHQWMESLMRCNDMTILCTYDPSTGRPYALEVDPKCQTCRDAQRYLLAPEIALEGLGISPEQAKAYPILRT